MSSTVLVLNCGSSSVKYELIAPRGDSPAAPDGTRIATGIVERIGEAGSRVAHSGPAGSMEREVEAPSHREALDLVLALFDEVGPRLGDCGLVAVGHRVVMGGRGFDGPVLIDEDVIAAVERWSPLAPLHNPPNLVGIEVARAALPDLAHVAVFDTGFFEDLPPAAATYALDREVAERHEIRRYGAHGTSHSYVSRRAAEVVGRDIAELRQIVLHLGNGASASAVSGGVAVDTSMGFTPLEGLVMGTRTGDIDAAVALHLIRHGGMDVDDVDDLLNRRSGMLGLAGSNDIRDIHLGIAAGDPDFRLALDVYVHRLKHYIGAYAAVMGGLDVLTFTAGVGENDPVVRAEATSDLGFLGIEVDPALNASDSREERRISPDGSRVAVLVIPTDEELEMATAALSLLEDEQAEGATRQVR